MEEISEDIAKSFKDKCTFLSPFQFLSDDFDIDCHDFNFNTLRKNANIKGSSHKNLEHYCHIDPNPQILRKSIHPSKRKLCSSHCKKLLKSGRIKETKAPLHHISSYCHQKQSQQTETYLGFATR